MKFQHLGIACHDIENALVFIRSTYQIANVSEIVYDPLQKASLCMVTIQDGTKIELISGDIVRNLLKKQIYLYHTCWQVEDIESAIHKFRQNGAVLISEPKPALLFNGKKVAFIASPLGIVELLEM